MSLSVIAKEHSPERVLGLPPDPTLEAVVQEPDRCPELSARQRAACWSLTLPVHFLGSGGSGAGFS